jgi:peptidoglycan/LPS O-acetylase OafA/YrhL
LRLDSIAFGVIIRIFFEKIKNNFLNFTLILLISFSMIYFEKNLVNLKNFELFGFVLLIQIISVNIIILFINFNKFITNNLIKKIFSLLSKQTYSIYLFHFAIIYLIKLNNLFLNVQWLFLFYLTFLFLFSTLFYYLLEKIVIENRPKYTNKTVNN